MANFASKIVVGICIAIVLLGMYAAYIYNSLQTAYVDVNSAEGAVGVQLQRRADLIPNLVNTVKGYSNYEEGVFKEVTEARTRMQNANTVAEKNNADGQLTTALTHFFAVSENYPDLKADKQFHDLMIELEGSENRVATARRDYNETIRNFNLKLRVFPTNLVAPMLGFTAKEQFKAEEKAEKVPEVSFK